MSAVNARQLSVSREKLFEWKSILCSVMTAQNNNITLRMPNCWNRSRTDVPLTGNVDDNGGCNACLSPAPIEKRTCGPPGGGTYKTKTITFNSMLSQLNVIYLYTNLNASENVPDQRFQWIIQILNENRINCAEAILWTNKNRIRKWPGISWGHYGTHSKCFRIVQPWYEHQTFRCIHNAVMCYIRCGWRRRCIDQSRCGCYGGSNGNGQRWICCCRTTCCRNNSRRTQYTTMARWQQIIIFLFVDWFIWCDGNGLVETHARAKMTICVDVGQYGHEKSRLETFVR